MAGFTHRYAATFGAGGDLIGSAVEVTSNTEHNISIVVPNATTDEALAVAWPSGKLNDLFITVDKDCTLEVNSSSAPTDTVALKAGIPFLWIKSSGQRAPFVGTAGTVTNLYVTVPDTDPVADCTFNLRAGVDL